MAKMHTVTNMFQKVVQNTQLKYVLHSAVSTNHITTDRNNCSFCRTQ